MGVTLRIATILLIAHAPWSVADTPRHATEATARAGLDALVSRLATGADGGERNAVVRVSAPAAGFQHASAAGVARADTHESMTPARPFYIASITKPMVAVRILQLVEAGRLSLDTSLAETGILPADALQRLHVHDGRVHGPAITIRQLLQHRTGLRDMLLDDRTQLGDALESGVAPGSLGGIWSSQLDRYVGCRQKPGSCTEEEMARLYPGHRWKAWDASAWTRNPGDRDAGLINFFLAEMDGAGLFPPGTDFHYADTNYILLGLVIERIAGRSLHAELRDAVFKPLGMTDTYLSYAPDPDARPRDLLPADFWVGDVPIISNDLDISFDWAGGGVVTTVADLDRFLRGVESAAVFRSTATRDAMLQCVETPSREGRKGGYGLGIRCLQTDYGPMWGHMGAWGAAMMLFPDHGVSITGTVSRLFDNEALGSLVFDSMAALQGAGIIDDVHP